MYVCAYIYVYKVSESKLKYHLCAFFLFQLFVHLFVCQFQLEVHLFLNLYFLTEINKSKYYKV